MGTDEKIYTYKTKGVFGRNSNHNIYRNLDALQYVAISVNVDYTKSPKYSIKGRANSAHVKVKLIFF